MLSHHLIATRAGNNPGLDQHAILVNGEHVGKVRSVSDVPYRCPTLDNDLRGYLKSQRYSERYLGRHV